MSRPTVITGTVFITLSIILGAIAAHALEKVVSTDLIEAFEKGVKYLIYSGLGLLILGLNHDRFTFSMTLVYRLVIWGTILFSGNIFIYIFHDFVPVLKHFVHLVPVGGTLMIAGWVVFLFRLLRTN